jgi:hypothetical protein
MSEESQKPVAGQKWLNSVKSVFYDQAKATHSFAFIVVPSGLLRMCECILTDDSPDLRPLLRQLSRSRTKLSHNETKSLKIYFS